MAQKVGEEHETTFLTEYTEERGPMVKIGE